MKIALICHNQIRYFFLPKVAKNSVWLTIFDDKFVEQNLISVEAIDGKWHLISNADTYYEKNGSMVRQTVLVEYQLYFLNSYHSEDRIILYCLPYYEQKVGVYDITNIEDKEITIGKLPECTINYQNKILDDIHAVIHRKSNQLFIKDNHSRYGVYVNNEKIIDTVSLKYGDVVFLFGLRFLVMKNGEQDVLIINNEPLNAKVYLNAANQIKPRFVFIDDEEEKNIHVKPKYYHKNPRFYTKIEPLVLKIDPPPAKENQQNSSMILTIVSMLTMSMTSLVTGFMAFNGVINEQRTLISALPSMVICVSMCTSTILLPTISRRIEKKRKKKREKIRQDKYKRYIMDSMNTIQREISSQSYSLRNDYPSTLECQNIILTKQVTLWNKRVEDEDFLSVSLGYGSIPMQIQLSYPEKHFSLEEDNLIDEVDRLGKEKKILSNVPIEYSFVKNFISCIIQGKNDYYNYLKNLLVQLIAFHSYDELKIVILTNKAKEKKWEDIKTLPHLWDDTKKVRFFASDIEEYNEINYLLSEVLNNNIDTKKFNNVKEVFAINYLIITDCFANIRNLDFIKNLLDCTSYRGFSLLMLEDTITSVPSECKSFIRLAEKNETFNKDYAKTAIEFSLDNYDDVDLKSCSKVLSNILVETQNKGLNALPTNVGILELYNVSKVEQLNVAARWNKNMPIFNMQVPVGVDEHGEIVYLDLHEKYHGPHGLIAGMTGSGKSEFLITYILSLAINYGPEEVQFAIIDYKGGGLSGAFTSNIKQLNLPHLVGTVTNLDDNDIYRILLSIQSEVERRQQAFNFARDLSSSSTIDIYKYQQLYKEKVITKPVSHLFIIVDEFAEMKKQHPEFMQQLISIARIGRSLGIHLILSTQKPSGVVDGQIWSNSRFRICFKVQDVSDSTEVIKKPDAAMIKGAGRFYLQVGYDELLKLVQSAYGGNLYIPSDDLIKTADTSINFINNLGNVIKNVDIPKQPIVLEEKIVESKALLNYLVKIGIEEKKETSSLWLEKLPANIYLENLISKYQFTIDNLKIVGIIGEYDSPATQERKLLTINLSSSQNMFVYGNDALEIENLLITFVYSMLKNYSSSRLQFYILDCGSESLKIFGQAPHVGDIITVEHAEKCHNLFKKLFKTIEHRKQLLSNIIGDYTNYVDSNGEKLPLITIVINNYSSFIESFEEYGSFVQQLTREGPRYGIVFIVTNNSQSGVGYKLLQNFKTTLALHLNDKNSYSSFIGKTKLFPSNTFGRGVINLETTYEFQTAFVTIRENIASFILEECKRLREESKILATSIAVLPEHVTPDIVMGKLNGLASVPVGIEKSSLQTVCYNFEKNYSTMVLADNLDITVPFTTSLINLLSNISHNKTIVIDPLAMIPDLNYQNVTVVHENIAQFLQQYIKRIEVTISQKEDIIQTEMVTFVIFSAYNSLHTLENTTEISDFIVKAKDCDNIRMILVDEVGKMKLCEYESWYRMVINDKNGIWIGESISNQYTLKTNKNIRERDYKINQNFGFVVESGKPKFIKIIQ